MEPTFNANCEAAYLFSGTAATNSGPEVFITLHCGHTSARRFSLLWPTYVPQTSTLLIVHITLYFRESRTTTGRITSLGVAARVINHYFSHQAASAPDQWEELRRASIVGGNECQITFRPLSVISDGEPFPIVTYLRTWHGELPNASPCPMRLS